MAGPVHLLGYFPDGGPTAEFRRLVDEMRWQSIAITLEELHERGGRLSGRLHIAAIPVEKAYAGLSGIEAYHSDHSTADIEYYKSLARVSLRITDVSDFHGSLKPRVALGTEIESQPYIAPWLLEELWLH